MVIYFQLQPTINFNSDKNISSFSAVEVKNSEVRSLGGRTIAGNIHCVGVRTQASSRPEVCP